MEEIGEVILQKETKGTKGEEGNGLYGPDGRNGQTAMIKIRVIVEVLNGIERDSVQGDWLVVPALMSVEEALRRAVETVVLPLPRRDSERGNGN